MVTVGKAVAGGLPMGAYGVTAELAEHLDTARSVATGGTLFGNPLSAAAAQVALTEVLVEGAYRHTSELGGELADGIEQAISAAGLPWTVIRFGPRSGQWYGPRPRTGAHTPSPTASSPGSCASGWRTGVSGKRSPALDPPSRCPPPALT